MAVNYGSGYNIYSSIRNKIRSKKAYDKYYGEMSALYRSQQEAQEALTVGGEDSRAPGVPIDSGTSAEGVRGPSLPGEFSSTVGGMFVETPDGPQQLSMDQIEAGLSIGVNQLTSGEYAISQATPYGVGAEIAKATGFETAGIFAENIVSLMDTSPFGAISGLMAGTKVKGPYGKEMTVPSGILGAVAEMSIKNQFEVAEKIKAGELGYHQMRVGGQLVSIVPQTIFGKQVGYSVLGTYGGTTQQAINQYASMVGLDPRTVDLGVTSGRPEGQPLDAFIAGVGGFTNDGMFASPLTGEVTDVSSFDMGGIRSQIGLVNTIYGPEKATSVINGLTGLSDSTRQSLAEGIASGSLTANQVVDNDGNVLGFSTMTGNVVRSADGIVTSGGRPVTSGTGIVSLEQVERAQVAAESAASESGRDMGVGTVSGYTTVSGRQDSGGDGPSESAGRSSTSEAAASEDAYSSDTYFAKGGRVGMQEGGNLAEQVPAGEAPVAAQAGFVGTEPENVAPAETIADDQALEVPEGTFVLNAAAVEFMGSADVKKMILDAMQEAEKQGIDIKQENAKIPKEDLVSLVVSKGEVIIPPQLAEIIGYDRLNKINNRGKAEVERRSQEAEQQQKAPTPEKPPILAKYGGFMAMGNGGEVDPEQSIVDYHYNTIKSGNVGRDEQGRPITVYSTSVYIPEGKNKGKFALVPGYVKGTINYSEDDLYQIWKKEIEAGKWPIDETGTASGKRAQRIHKVMDRDAETMPELKRETPPKDSAATP